MAPICAWDGARSSRKSVCACARSRPWRHSRWRPGLAGVCSRVFAYFTGSQIAPPPNNNNTWVFWAYHTQKTLCQTLCLCVWMKASHARHYCFRPKSISMRRPERRRMLLSRPNGNYNIKIVNIKSVKWLNRPAINIALATWHPAIRHLYAQPACTCLISSALRCDAFPQAH